MPYFTRIKYKGAGFEVEDSLGVILQVPDDMANRHRRMIQSDIDNDGATIDPEFDAAELLANSKRDAKAATKVEGIARIAAEVPALNSMEMVEFMVSLWPMLDTGSAPANILAARDIYQVAKSTLTAIDGMDQVALDAFDAATSPAWP